MQIYHNYIRNHQGLQENKTPVEFVRDSAFPFKVGEPLKARIEGDKIIIEKGQSHEPSTN